jgi:hypothetical protein
MKKKLYLFLISAALFASSSLRADLTSNLLLHYTFDNVTGGVVPDATGHGLDGMLMGGAVTGTGFGTSGNSISLTNAADYVQLPADVTTTLTDYTVACWVNLATLNYWGRIFDFGNGTATNMFLCPQDGSPYYAIKQRDVVEGVAGGGEESVKSNTAIKVNTWTHVAITCKFNETTGLGTMIMYINGSPVASKATTTISPASMGTTQMNYIGKSQYGADPTINGLIDDFRIYGRALTMEEVMNLKGVPASLITEYKNLAIAGDLTAVSGNLTLPTPSAGSNVTIAWTSTDSALVSPTGVVTQPAKFKAAATLTAILTITVDGVKTVLNKSFDIMVAPIAEPGETVALWNFADADITNNTDGTISVKEQSDNGYVGKCLGGAQILKIGKDKQFNVLSIKNSGQYFDFGTPIGEAVYGLTDYTVSVFYRRDTTIDHIQYINSYGQPLYGFSNTLNMANEAIGGMYYEPYRSRHVCTPNNYGSEGTNMVGTNTKTPLGTWHNVCYSQIAGVGHLYFDGVEVSSATMQSPAITLKKSGKTGTIYNSIGRPVYNTDPWLTNTLIYGFNMYSVGLTVDDLPTILNISGTIADLDAAITATTYDVYTYADLAAALATAKTAKASGYTPGLIALNLSLDSAQTAYDAKTPTKQIVTNLNAAVTVYNSVQATWIELGKLIPTTNAQVALGYPGLPAFQTAITAAQTAYNNYAVTAQTIADLNAAIKAYLLTKPASLTKPMDYTFNIINPSFELGTGGTRDPLSVDPGGSYNYPKGWTVYLNHSGWCNAAFITDFPSDGTKCFETWAATITEFDVYQSVDLPAGNYILSAQIRTNATGTMTQHIYARTADQNFVSGVLKDTLIGNWNGLTNWQTVYCVFSTTGGPTRIGFNSNGFMQFDNMKLTYTGADVPAKVNLTNYIVNPSFEEGTTAGVDASSIKAAGGSYQTPNGWTAYCNVKPTSGWCSVSSITGGIVNGTKAFETWCDSIISFKMSQKIVAPASGYYTLTADARCDASSPNRNDVYKYDARVFATPTKFPTKVSAKLGQQVVDVSGTWNSTAAWRTLSVNFQANVGDTVNIGIQSASFMQFDNFTLTYLAAANPALSVTNPKSTAGISIEVTPNPTSNFLNVKGLDAMSTVKIFNITGQRVFEGKANSSLFSIDCSKYSQGMYLLQVESQGKTVNTKFIKK